MPEGDIVGSGEERIAADWVKRYLQRYADYEERYPGEGQWQYGEEINHWFCYDAQPKIRFFLSPLQYERAEIYLTIPHTRETENPRDGVPGTVWFEQTEYEVFRDGIGLYALIMEDAYEDEIPHNPHESRL